MGPSTFAFAIAECCGWILSWVIGEGHDFKNKSLQELMYKCVFDSYLWVASNFCVWSSAELSI